MRYLTVSEYGSFLGLNSNCLVVKHNGEIVKEIALSHLRVIAILKSGVSLSSDLVQACAERSIKIFFLDWRQRIYSAVIGQNHHATVALRKGQFNAIDNAQKCCHIAREITYTKVKNQRAVLLYFGKYLSQDAELNKIIKESADKMQSISVVIKNISEDMLNWKGSLLGYEGAAAKVYWNSLSKLKLLSEDFENREGRSASSVTNKALNYGYAILLSQIWNALDNAGLEVFAGFYHEDRPGKPSLVLDVIEEYRAWVVDRAIIKLRDKLSLSKDLDFNLKKTISDSIRQILQSKYSFNKNKLKLENIIQRQVYKLSGFISDSTKKYKGYRFKW